MMTKKGQSALEYAFFVMLIIAALLATNLYIKRAIQGRWKANVDELGEQYDPTAMTTNIRYTTFGNSATHLLTQPGIVEGVPGFWTNRIDISDTIERKTGTSQVDAY